MILDHVLCRGLLNTCKTENKHLHWPKNIDVWQQVQRQTESTKVGSVGFIHINRTILGLIEQKTMLILKISSSSNKNWNSFASFPRIFFSFNMSEISDEQVERFPQIFRFNPNMMAECCCFLKQDTSTSHECKNKYLKDFWTLLTKLNQLKAHVQ